MPGEPGQFHDARPRRIVWLWEAEYITEFVIFPARPLASERILAEYFVSIIFARWQMDLLQNVCIWSQIKQILVILT